MQLHQLSPQLRRKKEKRVGRGGKRGKTAGRGEKGQGARAGHRIRPAERDLIQRIPKLRGMKNRRISNPPSVVKTGDLTRFEGNEVTRAALAAQGFIPRAGERVKIVRGGRLVRALIIKDIPVSAGAKEAIETAGGKAA
ncbi:MAG: 50S ribosomal protein L15 [Candidatus Brennerbacteria bacterium]|nr:50S ribosomal protein L15 [Candidatus Brennerbacteria bacterium]